MKNAMYDQGATGMVDSRLVGRRLWCRRDELGLID